MYDPRGGASAYGDVIARIFLGCAVAAAVVRERVLR